MAVALNSCLPNPATDQQKQDKMKSVHFDQNIIQDIDKYENLKTFLALNIDTIIEYRHSKNTATLIRGQGLSDSTYLADDDCYNFFQGNDRYNIANVPDNLKSELDSLFHTFSNYEINSFGICKNKKISIEIRSEGGDNGLYISHTLLWNAKVERDYAYDDNKDTLINGNCIYRIGLTEHHGH